MTSKLFKPKRGTPEARLIASLQKLKEKTKAEFRKTDRHSRSEHTWRGRIVGLLDAIIEAHRWAEREEKRRERFTSDGRRR